MRLNSLEVCGLCNKVLLKHSLNYTCTLYSHKHIYVCINIKQFTKANNSVFKHELIKLYSLLSLNKLYTRTVPIEACGEGEGQVWWPCF